MPDDRGCPKRRATADATIFIYGKDNDFPQSAIIHGLR